MERDSDLSAPYRQHLLPISMHAVREQSLLYLFGTRPDASRDISSPILLRIEERNRRGRGILVPRQYGLNILLPVFPSYSLPHQIGTEACRLRKPPLSKSRGHHVVCPPPPVQNQIELQTRERLPSRASISTPGRLGNEPLDPVGLQVHCLGGIQNHIISLRPRSQG